MIFWKVINMLLQKRINISLLQIIEVIISRLFFSYIALVCHVGFFYKYIMLLLFVLNKNLTTPSPKKNLFNQFFKNLNLLNYNEKVNVTAN